jgi:hypothetical protein
MMNKSITHGALDAQSNLLSNMDPLLDLTAAQLGLRRARGELILRQVQMLLFVGNGNSPLNRIEVPLELPASDEKA